MKVVDSKGHETIEKASGSGLDMPIIVLINKGSASASEVLSVALHDNKKAQLLGEKSFGKGIIQSIFPINNEGKAEGIKITIAEYFGPNGTKINKVGLEPDHKVEQKKLFKDWYRTFRYRSTITKGHRIVEVIFWIKKSN